MSGIQALKGALAIEIGHGRGDEVPRLGELHDVLFDVALLLRLYLHPSRIRIQFAKFGVESLHKIGMRFNIAPQRLLVLLPLALIFFGILLLLRRFCIWVRERRHGQPPRFDRYRR